jgi:hypothetical protein
MLHPLCSAIKLSDHYGLLLTISMEMVINFAFMPIVLHAYPLR